MTFSREMIERKKLRVGVNRGNRLRRGGHWNRFEIDCEIRKIGEIRPRSGESGICVKPEFLKIVIEYIEKNKLTRNGMLRGIWWELGKYGQIRKIELTNRVKICLEELAHELRWMDEIFETKNILE